VRIVSIVAATQTTGAICFCAVRITWQKNMSGDKQCIHANTAHGDQYAGPKDARLSAVGHWAALEGEEGWVLALQTNQ